MTSRVLVYRSGSLGDTIVALPCFHLIRRAFPQALIRVMADLPHTGRALSLEAILGGSGLVDEVVSHPRGLRDPVQLSAIAMQIRRWRPEVVVHLPAFPTIGKVARDVAFFRLSGGCEIVGVPWSADLRTHRFDAVRRVYETEASRLARCLAPLGPVDLADSANWRLNQTAAERDEAVAALAGWDGRDRYVVFSPGTKVPANDWGDANWRIALAEIARLLPGVGLLTLGGRGDGARADALVAQWPGPRLNLCGTVSPRVSALLLQDARLYLGHDSGPMHLAASVGTPCVCVFSRHNLPGCWFPIGTNHQPLYPWRDDGAIRCEDAGIGEICPDHVVAAARRALALPRSSNATHAIGR